MPELRPLLSSMVLLGITLPAWPQEDRTASVLATIHPAAIRAHMGFLADDLLEGRGTGSRGYDLAARYVAAQFESMGLEPAGGRDTYFQTVPLRQIHMQADASSMVLSREGKSRTLAPGKDFLMSGHEVHTRSEVEAPLVFAGYGVTAPELGYDDYAGFDVGGKIVVVLSGAPPTFPSAERAHFSSRITKADSAARRGAVGLSTLWTERDEQLFAWHQVARLGRAPTLRWLGADGVPNDARPELHANVLLSLAVSRSLFDDSPESWERIQSAAQQGRPRAFPLRTTARLTIASRHTTIESPNVVAILRGSDPGLRDEVVVYTAHLDHEGIGEPREGDAIYNGALDNASGVAQMLEVARAFTRLPEPPRRSILFVAVTAEEKGLLGSDYFVRHPTVPTARMVANVNLDGGLILFPPADVVAHGAEHSTLGAIVQKAARRLELELSPDPSPEQSFFIRSDQYSFVKQGIPAVFIFPGMKSADPAVNGPAAFNQYLSQRYHTPQDDMSQPLSFEAGATGARLNFMIGYEVAQADERPRWNPGDFFGKTFAGKR